MSVNIRIVSDRPALAMVHSRRRYLIVTDLHIGYEEELFRMGIRVPYQAPRIAASIREIIDEVGAQYLVLLGDVKHRVAGTSWRESRQVRDFVQRVREGVDEVIIVPGNHDAGIYSLVGDLASVVSSRGFGLGEVWLLHGHTWPQPQSLEKKIILIGHTHPTISLEDEGSKLRRRVFLKLRTEKRRLAEKLRERPGYAPLVSLDGLSGDIKLIILPHFNDALSGLSVSGLSGTRGISPLLRSGAFDPLSAEATLMDGTQIGTIRSITK
ncbi:MAG: metallophosphoesterase [Aigarchaeota archaeon]|nr:metallophosphoesterase [Aigarchaeota archaeon]MDW8092706.1 metallophosphoesterase [Nitrososphaerota archaeon]